MDRYINIFSTSGDVQTAVDNGELLKPYVAYVESEDKIDWNTKNPPIDYSQVPLTVVALNSGSVKLEKTYNTATKYKYIKNNESPVSGYVSSTQYIEVPLVEGDELVIIGYQNSQYGGIKVSVSSDFSFNLKGNITSTILGDVTEYPRNNYNNGNTYGLNVSGSKIVDASDLWIPVSKYEITKEMFKNCSVMTKAPKILPNTVLYRNCYEGMFKNCYALTTSPILPATTLAEYCYSEMFMYCTSLTKAPDLLAETLTPWCYNYMFLWCTKLDSVRCLATDISASKCTREWLEVVMSNGTFTKKSGVTWPAGESGIPSGWTVIEE